MENAFVLCYMCQDLFRFIFNHLWLDIYGLLNHPETEFSFLILSLYAALMTIFLPNVVVMMNFKATSVTSEVKL